MSKPVHTVLIDGYQLTNVFAIEMDVHAHSATIVKITVLAESLQVSADGVMSIGTGKEEA